jgi:ArsR family transcriptional regulator, cadmium/lead-responsive transcriptional repressor
MTMETAELNDAAVAATLFRGLADPTRLRVLLALQAGERRVVDLVAELRMAQATISAHVACLCDCGLVTGRAEGRQTFYALALPQLRTLLVAAEEVLSAVGREVSLCTNYSTRA